MEQRRIGRYYILERIASGSQATVYRATWGPHGGAEVALKLLHSHLATDQNYLNRFHQEYRLAASSNHPYVVRIFDVCQHGSGLVQEDEPHFISMEYLPQSLHTLLLAQGRLPLERAVDIARQVALGLEFISSEHGIIHRDVKPDNILLTSDGTAKLTDFGIARAADLSTKTITGLLMGTPNYMSPEQCRGERIDVRSDIYSLGVVLYQMLTGEPPFKDDNAWEVIRLHQEAQPRPVQELRPRVPLSLAAVVERCLEKESGRRYQGPLEVAQALQAVLLVERVEVSGITDTIHVGERRELKARAWDAEGSPLAHTQMLWASSNPQVVAVSRTGIASAVGVGQATLTAQLEGKQGKVQVTVQSLAILEPVTQEMAPAEPLTEASSFGAELLPQKAEGASGSYSLRLTNWGRGEVSFDLAGWDPEERCRFRFDPPEPRVAPGESLEVALKVEPGLRPLSGQGMGYWFTLSVAPQEGGEPPVILGGELEATPWLPRKALVVGAGAVAGVVVLVVWVLFNVLVPRYTLTVKAAGLGSISPVGGNFKKGERVDLVPAAASGWRFVRWEGDCNGTSVPCILRLDANRNVMAFFEPIPPPLRIEAGSASPYTDSSGNVWTADVGFLAGQTVDRGNNEIGNTLDDRIYQTERYAMSGYTFDIPNGSYTVRLHFAENYVCITGPGQRVFSVSVEGVAINNLDIFAETGGHNRALVKTVGVHVTDGQLDVVFIPSVQNPEINGIEILDSSTVTPSPTPPPTSTPPSTPLPPMSAPIRIEAGSASPYTDTCGNVWRADTGFLGGQMADPVTIEIANTSDDRIYQTERYAMSGYALDIPNGSYTVRLHFAENYWRITGPGQRVFSVNVEGVAINNLDIFAETGGRHRALVKSVVVQVSDGQLNVVFIPLIQNPEINGIEILDRILLETP